MSNKVDNRWPLWGWRIKDIVEIVAIVVGGAFAWYGLDAVWDQLSLTREQIQLAEGPSLTIKPINQLRDFKPFSGKMYTPSGKIDADSTRMSTLTLSINNIGRSSANVDTMYFELVDEYDEFYVSQGSDYTESVIFPNQPLILECPLKLDKESVNVLRVVVIYRWAESNILLEPRVLDRAYAIEYNQTTGVWRTSYRTSAHWKAHVGDREVIIMPS